MHLVAVARPAARRADGPSAPPRPSVGRVRVDPPGEGVRPGRGTATAARGSRARSTTPSTPVRPTISQGVAGLPDVAVAEHRDAHVLLQRGDRVPVRLTRVGLLRGPPVQGDRRTPGLLRDPARVQVGLVIMVDPDPGLHGHRHAVRRRRPDHGASRSAPADRRLYGSAAPPPLRVTLGTGQPKFRSTWSTAKSLIKISVARAHGHRVDPVQLHATGPAPPGRTAACPCVLRSRSTIPRLVIISQTNSPACPPAGTAPASACSRHSCRYAALVIPAIGAKITGVSTFSEPRLSPPEREPCTPAPPPSQPSKTIERDAAGSGLRPRSPTGPREQAADPGHPTRRPTAERWVSGGGEATWRVWREPTELARRRMVAADPPPETQRDPHHRPPQPERSQDQQPTRRVARYAVTWSRPTRSCAIVSRSRIVTASSSRVSKSTVMQYGVPISSWRR